MFFFNHAYEPATIMFCFDIALKSTLILLIGLVAARWARRYSAALRHRIWTLTFLGLGLMPALLMVMPQWSLAVVPDLSQWTEADAINNTDEVQTTSRERNMPDRIETQASEITAGRRESESGISEAHFAANTQLKRPPVNGDLQQTPRRNPVRMSQQDVTGNESLPTYTLLMIWLVGVSLSLLPILLSTVYFQRLSARAFPVSRKSGIRAAQRVRHRIGLHREVRLLESRENVVPMTWGLWRPVVILPQTVDEMDSRPLESGFDA